jgi:hypothetical protein
MALVSVALTMLVSALILLPYPLKMDATGKLLPTIRAVSYSPVAGRINEFMVVPSEEVVENRVLVRMYDPELEGKIAKLRGEEASARGEAESLEAQEKMTTLQLTERSKLTSQKNEKRRTQQEKQRELLALIARTNADPLPHRSGFFYLKAPVFTPEQARQIENAPYRNHEKKWTVLNGNFREEWTNKEAKPSDALLRLGAQDGPWEIELNIPQKHIGQVLKAFEAQKRKGIARGVLDVDFLLRSDPTRVFKGKLFADKVAPEANPNKEEGTEAEPIVLAIVAIDDKTIAQTDRLPHELLLSHAEVHAKIRCGDKPMYYSLFYGVWEFFYEKVVFFF